MSLWLLAVAIPVVASLLLFRPLLKERRWLPLGLTLLLLLPASGLLLYQWVVTPQAVHSSRAPAPVSGNEMDALLAQLQARPPRYLVWDDGALRVDGLADEFVFGEPLLRWLEESYEEEQRFGAVSIRGFRPYGAADRSRSE